MVALFWTYLSSALTPPIPEVGLNRLRISNRLHPSLCNRKQKRGLSYGGSIRWDQAVILDFIWRLSLLQTDDYPVVWATFIAFWGHADVLLYLADLINGPTMFADAFGRSGDLGGGGYFSLLLFGRCRVFPHGNREDSEGQFTLAPERCAVADPRAGCSNTTTGTTTTIIGTSTGTTSNTSAASDTARTGTHRFAEN